jgi:hypothetical protein
MFHLGGRDFPANAKQLRDALTESFAHLLRLPPEKSIVVVEGGAYPAVERIRIDLNGAVVEPGRKSLRPIGVGNPQPGITVECLQIAGNPIRYQEAALTLALAAQNARFAFDRDIEGRPLLTLTETQEGRVEAAISKADIEALLLAGARAAAKSQGIAVEQTQLTLTSQGNRSVGVDLRVRARKGFLGATIRVKGRLDVDDELNAQISGLTCDGEGMIGAMACGFITPHLQKFEGRQLPLMAFSLGDVRLRDLTLQVSDGLRVRAAFGS